MVWRFFQQRRHRLGLSQEQVGIACGVRKQAVQRWEQGYATPRLEHVPGLSRVLGVCRTRLVREIGRARMVRDRAAFLRAEAAFLRAETNAKK